MQDKEQVSGEPMGQKQKTRMVRFFKTIAKGT